MWHAWVIAGAFLPLLAFEAPFRILAALVLLAAMLWTGHALLRRRPALRKELVRRLTEEDRVAAQRARVEYESQDAVRRTEWAEEQALRERLRSAVSREDLDALALVLEAELSNERLPVPLVFDVELDGAEDARIEPALPELQEVPAERLSLTNQLDPATGAEKDLVALKLDASREDLERLNLDGVHAPAALEHLGGRLGVARDGSLGAV